MSLGGVASRFETVGLTERYLKYITEMGLKELVHLEMTRPCFKYVSFKKDGNADRACKKYASLMSFSRQ